MVLLNLRKTKKRRQAAGEKENRQIDTELSLPFVCRFLFHLF